MIVADTHIIIWDALTPRMLSNKAKKALGDANNAKGIIFCEISLWEIAILMKKKRLQVNCSFIEFINLLLESRNYTLKGITPEIADLSVDIEGLRGDPADRIIAATTLAEKTKLVTADKEIIKSNRVTTIW